MFNWIKDLQKDGFTYIFMKKGSSKVFYATKATMKNGDFDDEDLFYEFRLDKNEKWIPGVDAKNVFIAI